MGLYCPNFRCRDNRHPLKISTPSILYSGKFLRGPIFAERQSSKILRSNFCRWSFQNCSIHNTGLTLPLTASELSDSSVLITRFTSALADSMDDEGTVVDREPHGSGSLVVSLDALNRVTETFL